MSITMTNAWDNAENTIFTALAAALQSRVDTDCFRGYLPITPNGEPKYTNVWRFSSGGTGGAFDAERTYGTGGNWCSMLCNAEVTGIFVNRSRAMKFAGAVMDWLKTTNNFNATGNVTWCHLRDLPESPVEEIVGRKRFWSVVIPLEILYLTGGTYPTG